MPPRKKTKAAAAPRGIAAAEVGAGSAPPPVRQLREEIEQDGGSVLAEYREPLGSHWQLVAALPIEKVFPTPFQRDLSEAHVKRLTGVIDKLDRFLDPIITVRSPEGNYWTPNGHHRLSALRKLGARAVIALVLPDTDVAYKILALNTEKAHNLREKSLEVIRMARELASRESRPEKDYELEFEEAAFVTLGICYEKQRAVRRRRVPPAAQARGRFPRVPSSRRPPGAGAPGRSAPRARRGGRAGHEGPAGPRLQEPLPARLRRRAHQPDPVQEGAGRLRRDAGER